MGLLSLLLERRSGLTTLSSNPASWLLDAMGGLPSVTGERVSPERARGLPVLWACIRAISEDEASLPLCVYQKRKEGGREKATDHPLWGLLHDSPNPWQTSLQFREMLTAHACLRGNGYAVIVSSGGGRVTALLPQHPDQVTLLLAPDGELWYQVAPAQQGAEVMTYRQDEILHLRGPSDDGYSGLSMVEVFRNSLGLGLAGEKYAGKFFANDASPGGLVKHPAKLSKDAHEKLKASWRARHEGTDNAFRLGILEEGMTFERLNFSQKDAQFLESRQFQIEEICRVFRMPPHIVQHLARSTNNNIEQQFIEYVTLTLRPWLVRWEQQLAKALLTQRDRSAGIYIEHQVDGLLRGDAKSRAESLAIQRQNGALTANEWREFENRNPVPGGDVLLVPLNFTSAETYAAGGAAGGQPVAAGSGVPNDGGRGPAAGAAPAGAGASPEGDVQATALNGAQVTSLVEVLQAVAKGQLPIESAKGVILLAFPTVTQAQLDAMLGALEGFEPTPEAPKPGPGGAPPAEPADPADDAAEDDSEDGAAMRALRRAAALGIGDAVARIERRRQTAGPKGLADYASRALEPALLAFGAGLAELRGQPIPDLTPTVATLVARYLASDGQHPLAETALASVETAFTASAA